MKFKRILSAILLFAFLCGQSSVPSLALLPETSSVAHAEDKKTVTVPTEKEVYGKKLETILSFSTRYNEDPALILTDSKEKIGNFHDAIVDVRTNAEKTKTYYPALEQSFFDLASQHEDQLTNLIRQIHEFREDEKNEVAKERALKNSDFLKKNYYPTLISTLQKAGIKPGEETTAATVCALPRWNEITKKMKELAYPKNNLVDEILIANLCAKPNEVVIKTEASYNSYWSQLEAEQEKIRQAYSDTVYGFSLLTSPAKDKGNEYWEKDSSGKYQLSHWKPSNYATFTDKIFKGAGLNPLFSSASRGTYIVGQSIGIYEGKEGIQVGGEYLGSDGSLVQLKQAISNANALSLILFSEAAKQFSKPEYTAGLYDDLIVENRTNFEDGAWFGNKENPTLFNKDAKPVKTVREAMAMVTFYDPVDPNSDPRAKEIYDSQKEIGDKVANGYQSTTPEPCGSSGIGLVKGLSQGVCALVVFSHRFITSILWSSTYLLSTQANFFKRCEDGSVSCGSDINYASKDESSGAAADLLGQFEGTEFTDPIQNIVVDTTNTNIGTVVQLAYGTSLKFLNFLLILIFLAIAIANILQIQINNYSVKKVLPGLLIGFMVAQFSLFLIRGSLELADQVGKGVLSQATNSNMSFRGFITAFSSFPFTVEEIAKTSSPNCKPERDVAWLTIGCGTTNGSSDVDFNKVFKLALVDIFTLIASVFLLVLGFQFILRRIVFFFLIPLAPLAFAVSTFDPAKKLWSTWQKNFWNWLIMPLVASFWLWLALLWLSNGTIGNGGPLAAIMSYLFAFFALFQAVKSPSQYAGDAKAALGSWNKFGKSVFGDRAKYAIARYTPAGALTRGYLKNQALWKEKQKEQLEGDVFKSKTARALGGDAINRRIEGSWKEQDRKKKDQESYSERIKQRAEEDVFNRDLRRERGIAARNAQSEQIKERLHDERDKLTTDYKRNNESYKELQAAIELETEANTNFKNGLKKEITARTKEIKKGHAFHEWQKSKAFEMDATNRDLNAETERGSGDDFAKAFERNVVVKELKAKIESNWESERKAAAYTQMAADVGGAFSKVD
ncbi:MAG: hypothetical protein K0S20_408 [Patescibacteria group bacterium]|nr:hypothetical protein [Patescibacteria group bacterium]